jgi:hypothetical protein
MENFNGKKYVIVFRTSVSTIWWKELSIDE